MSLKGTERDISLKDVPKVRKAVADRNVKLLTKYVENGVISTEIYEQLMEEIKATPNKPTKDKKDRDLSRKIKHVLCSIAAFVLLFGSMTSTLGEIVVRHGKGIAFWYFFLWLWAFSYAVEKDSKSKEISRLKTENERLKERIEISKDINKEL